MAVPYLAQPGPGCTYPSPAWPWLYLPQPGGPGCTGTGPVLAVRVLAVLAVLVLAALAVLAVCLSGCLVWPGVWVAECREASGIETG